MKNIIKIVVIAAMIVLMPMTAFAVENDSDVTEMNDSLNISTEIKQQLGVGNTEKAIKMFNVSMHFAFADIHNIDELLEKDDLILSEYYAIQSVDGTLSYKDIIDGTVVSLAGDMSTNQKAIKFLQDNTVATKIPAGAEIYETYYLSGENSYSGTAIYYKTNKGDFVYYSHYTVGDSEYLFPVKDFCEYQRALYDEMGKYPDLDGGVDISQLWDLTRYDIHSEDFNIQTDIEHQIIDDDRQQQNGVDVVTSLKYDDFKNVAKWGMVFIGALLLIVAAVFVGIRIKNNR